MHFTLHERTGVYTPTPTLLSDLTRIYRKPLSVYFASKSVLAGDSLLIPTRAEPQALLLAAEDFTIKIGGRTYSPLNSKLLVLLYEVVQLYEAGKFASEAAKNHFLRSELGVGLFLRQNLLDAVALEEYQRIRPFIKRTSPEWKSNVRPLVQPVTLDTRLEERVRAVCNRISN